jgi:hypothetical protein
MVLHIQSIFAGNTRIDHIGSSVVLGEDGFCLLNLLFFSAGKNLKKKNDIILSIKFLLKQTKKRLF